MRKIMKNMTRFKKLGIFAMVFVLTITTIAPSAYATWRKSTEQVNEIVKQQLSVKEASEKEYEETYLSDITWDWAYSSSKNIMYEDKSNLPSSPKSPAKNHCYGQATKKISLCFEETTLTNYDALLSLAATKQYDKGIGTEACSEIVYNISQGYDRFQTDVGFDNYVLTNSKRPSSVQFKVLGSKGSDISTEYEVLYDSGLAYSATGNAERPYFVAESLDISIKGYNYLKLWVSDAGETGTGGTNPTNQSDTVNWAGAKLLIEKEESLDPLDSITLEIDKKELNPVKNPNETASLTVTGYDSDSQKIDLAGKGYEITYNAENVKASGDVTVASVDSTGKVTGIEGGISRLTVTVKSEKVEKTASVDVVVRPFNREYHQTMVMKMFMGKDKKVNMTFAEALETIKKINNLTVGVPKIIYLVGWQYDGHDSGYPSWGKVNEGLKRPQDATAEDSLRWLMREAKKYNTTVSLHINILDASSSSPLWQEYVDKDIIAKEEDGTLRTYLWGYPISYTAEWNAGLFQRRVDELIDMLPELVDGGTIHVDAFHSLLPQSTEKRISPYHEKEYGYTTQVEIETQRKMIKYFRSKGLDFTSEFVNNYREDNLIGLQAMAWHFRTVNADWYLNVPASLYCGGDSGLSQFGENMLGESIIKSDKTNLKGFLSDFALKSVPFYYLNRLERIDYKNSTAYYSNNVTSTGSKILQGDVVLRENNNILMPALWKGNASQMFAYSKDGYSNLEWKLPVEFNLSVKAVDIYNVGLTGYTLLESDVSVADGKLTLTLLADQGVMIVPAGTIPDNNAQVGSFELKSPTEGEKDIQSPVTFTWTEEANAKSYRIIVSDSIGFENDHIILDETVTETTAQYTGELKATAVYYWKVIASCEIDGVTVDMPSKNGIGSFVTLTDIRPEAPTNLKAAKRANGIVVLSWKKADGEVDSYNVYRSISGGEFEKIATGIKDTEYIDTQASVKREAADFRYYVTAVNKVGEGTASNIAEAVTEEYTYLSDLDWLWAYAGTKNNTMYLDKEKLPSSPGLPKKDFRHGSSATSMYMIFKETGETDYNTLIGDADAKQFTKGVSVTAGSEIIYNVQGFDLFETTVGFDCYVLTNKKRPSSVNIKVLGSKTEDKSTEYEVLYESQPAYSAVGNPDRPHFLPQNLKIDITDYKYLKLWVDDNGEGGGATDPTNNSDTVNWGEARVSIADRPVTGVILDKTKIEIKEGETASLTASIKPENADNKQVAWSTDDAAVATVTDGVVKGIAEGKATITVITADGNYTATCEVTVMKKEEETTPEETTPEETTPEETTPEETTPEETTPEETTPEESTPEETTPEETTLEETTLDETTSEETTTKDTTTVPVQTDEETTIKGNIPNNDKDTTKPATTGDSTVILISLIFLGTSLAVIVSLSFWNHKKNLKDLK